MTGVEKVLHDLLTADPRLDPPTTVRPADALQRFHAQRRRRHALVAAVTVVAVAGAGLTIARRNEPDRVVVAEQAERQLGWPKRGAGSFGEAAVQAWFSSSDADAGSRPDRDARVLFAESVETGQVALVEARSANGQNWIAALAAPGGSQDSGPFVLIDEASAPDADSTNHISAVVPEVRAGTSTAPRRGALIVISNPSRGELEVIYRVSRSAPFMLLGAARGYAHITLGSVRSSDVELMVRAGGPRAASRPTLLGTIQAFVAAPEWVVTWEPRGRPVDAVVGRAVAQWEQANRETVQHRALWAGDLPDGSLGAVVETAAPGRANSVFVYAEPPGDPAAGMVLGEVDAERARAGLAQWIGALTRDADRRYVIALADPAVSSYRYSGVRTQGTVEADKGVGIISVPRPRTHYELTVTPVSRLRALPPILVNIPA